MCKNEDMQVTDVLVYGILFPSFPMAISKPNQDDYNPIAKKKRNKFHSQQKLQKKNDYFSTKYIMPFELSIQILWLQ